MRYLLVMPQITKDSTQWYQFPIGIAYISSSLKAAGYDVINLNLNYKQQEIGELIKETIEKYDIDVIATGGLSTQYNDLKEIIDCARQVKPNIITMVGGGIITGDAEAAMSALTNVDYGMLGEGEETICELAAYLENKGQKDIDQIKGIIYRKEDKLICTESRKEIMDLDSIPFPDYDGFEYDKVIRNKPTDHLYDGCEYRTAFLCGSRSCIYACTFCFHSSGKKYRKRSIDNIFKEIDWLVSKYPIEHLYLVDELFANEASRVNEFCERIKKYNIKWTAQFRVDIVTKELLTLLKDSNCQALMFGLESADDRILKSMRKNITISQIENALSLCHEVGIKGIGGFIFGDLEETTETVDNTLNWWKEHPQYSINLSMIRVYPGSYLYKVACNNNIIQDRVKFLIDGCPMTNVSKLTNKEYSEMSKKIDNILEEDKMTKLQDTVAQVVGRRIDLKGRCPYCNKMQEWSNLDAFRRVLLTCPNCKNAYRIRVYEYLDNNFRKNVIDIMNKSNKIALWPRTASAYNMISAAPELLSDKVFLVDKSVAKQGTLMLGKTTYSPQVIEKENIETVIITLATNVEGEITREIQRDYPNVKQIVKVGELLEKNIN